MQTENLPTDELIKFGIIDHNLSFSKKLTEEDIQKFLRGHTIVADHQKKRATFQLTDNNTRLKVIFLERDRSISEILQNSKHEIQYSEIRNMSKLQDGLNIQKKAFIYDKEKNHVTEFDLVKNAAELTAVIYDKKDDSEMNRYRADLLKLKNFLQDKIVQHPQFSKEISEDLNIISREIDYLNNVPAGKKQLASKGQSASDLNVNDRNKWEDANRIKNEEIAQQESEQDPDNIRVLRK